MPIASGRHSWKEFYDLTGQWDATIKARAVLFSLINEEQRQSYKDNGFFKESVNIVIGYGQHWNVHIDGESYCSVNKLHFWGPAEICLVPQLLLLRRSVRMFERVSRCGGSMQHAYIHITDNCDNRVRGYYNFPGTYQTASVDIH